MPAAFGRLCVETGYLDKTFQVSTQPPSGGCVLKQVWKLGIILVSCPAAFGRLCVETASVLSLKSGYFASRLRAAVC